jgi:hypothetical protein
MKKLIAMMIIAVTLGACSKSMSDNYVGKWQSDGNGMFAAMMQQQVSTKDKKNMPIMIISKNGDIYKIVEATTNEPIAYCPTGATLKDSKLDCAAQYEFTFDVSTGKLLTPTLGTFTKIN